MIKTRLILIVLMFCLGCDKTPTQIDQEDDDFGYKDWPGINNNGIFTITPDKSIPVFVSKDPNKFKIMIWVWNEEDFVSLADKEFSFKK